MAARRISLSATGAIVCASIVVWISLGAITFTGVDAAAPRVAILPSLGWLAAFITAALLVAAFVRLRPRRVAILWLSGLAVLPWLPFRVPVAVFVWAGAFRVGLWAAIAAAILTSIVATRVSPAIRRSFTSPRSAVVWAAALSAIAFSLGAWAVAPRQPVGDEPHYLIITQSLLLDHDLQIENNHRRGDYRAYFRGGDMKPDYLNRGANGQIYSIHAPGLPVLIAPAFALFGYRGVVAMLVALAACATALAWFVAWRVTADAGASWFAWTAVTLSVPFFYQAFAVFPDGVGAALVLVGMLPLVDERARRPRPLFGVGATVAILPWLHTRFAIAAAVLAVVIIGRIVRAGARSTIAFLVCPLLAGAAWFAFFAVVYGTPNPAAPYGASQLALTNLARGVAGLMFDQQFGLLPNAPVYVCALAGLWVMAAGGQRRLAVELTAIVTPYFLAVAAFPMWWGGYSAPARFLVPIALVLAIPAAVWYTTRRTVTARLLGLGAALASAIIVAAVAITDRGAALFNVRDGSSRLLLALSPVVDVTTAVPSLFATSPARTALHGALWLSVAAFAFIVGRAFERRGWFGQPLAAIVAASAALAAIGVTSVVWRLNGAVPITASRGGFALLRRYDPDRTLLAIAYSPFRHIAPSEVPPQLALAERTFSRRASNPIVSLANVPAGVYEISGAVRRDAGGRVRVATDARLPSIGEWDIASRSGPWRQTVTFPVALAALRLEADTAAQASLASLSFRAQKVFSPREAWPDVTAGHATRYGPAVVFVTGGHAYMEPGGTWVAGGSYADFVVLPDSQSTIHVFIRNSAVQNTVALESGSWRDTLSLQPREERMVSMPNRASRAGVPLRVTSGSGWVPADVDPHTDDLRFLGCWVETR